MVFSSLIFLYLFLPALLLAYFTFSNASYRIWVLIVFSYIFYAWGEPVWVVLLLLASLLGYLFALAIDRYKGRTTAKLLYTLAIVINLGLLGFFKYAGFLVENMNRVLSFSIPVPDIDLPIGISFFTFELICYLTDVYRGKIAAPKSPKKVLFYVSFFPHLVAGPIIRYSDIEQQIDRPQVTWSGFSEGLTLFMVGLGKKVVLANLMGEVVTQLLNPDLESVSVLGMWLGLSLFALQIYFDFSGYSDMAIGLGKMLGFKLRENFDYPYLSKTMGEFWRRWNMSLGGFFRDYVYIPLGGSRRYYVRNLLVVWCLTGIWHGASWNFVIWGLYCGALIYLERTFIGRWLTRLPVALQHVYALIAILLGWNWFYFTDLSQALRALSILVGIRHETWVNAEFMLILQDHLLLYVAGLLLSTPLLKYLVQYGVRRLSDAGKGNLIMLGAQLTNGILLALSTILLVGSSYNPFLYYRF